ncbi:DUF5994 family protein [Nocardia otitidiscaviarum]|uniref:DUF5994 family protein n=1 Tax=Nocardia otitidiscaviarum TaxID=1823 RepID=UPI000A72BA96|nr:DUF5994 family protein [Nocardia otitidiscaviarum]
MNDDSRTRPITNHAAMTDAPTSARERQPFPAPTRTPRLRLRDRDAEPAQVDGAWWPWTPNLTTELHDLISALTPRLGTLARIGFAWNTISLNQRHIDPDDDVNTHGPDPEQPPDIMEAFGTNGAHATLLIIPSDTDPRLAGERMRQILE